MRELAKPQVLTEGENPVPHLYALAVVFTFSFSSSHASAAVAVSNSFRIRHNPFADVAALNFSDTVPKLMLPDFVLPFSSGFIAFVFVNI